MVQIWYEYVLNVWKRAFRCFWRSWVFDTRRTRQAMRGAVPVHPEPAKSSSPSPGVKFLGSQALPKDFNTQTKSNKYSPRFAWGGRPHRRFISVRERG